ncbi:sugar phosphate nucleotidyltransferase [Tepidibacillus marianensis]|uniref:sugar phosphate nucleotidyltransferase n=1 Tax=Tepidibacillus marianensis TaxID=3131995 RepID=UPI0030CEA595
MEDVMAVINLSNDLGDLHELTIHRSSASVPFGGRYRLIDFTLSNLANSGIRDVSVFIKNKYRSLMDHLGTGSDWDLDRKKGGCLFCLLLMNNLLLYSRATCITFTITLISFTGVSRIT